MNETKTKQNLNQTFSNKIKTKTQTGNTMKYKVVRKNNLSQ